jgi:hypothetical protein
MRAKKYTTHTIRQTETSQTLSAELQLENKLQEKNPQNYKNHTQQKWHTCFEATGEENAANLKGFHIHHHSTRICFSMNRLSEKHHMHHTES